MIAAVSEGWYGRHGAMQLIKAGADINIKTKVRIKYVRGAHTISGSIVVCGQSGTTALIEAAIKGRADVAKALIIAGADITHKNKVRIACRSRRCNVHRLTLTTPFCEYSHPKIPTRSFHIHLIFISHIDGYTGWENSFQIGARKVLQSQRHHVDSH